MKFERSEWASERASLICFKNIEVHARRNFFFRIIQNVKGMPAHCALQKPVGRIIIKRRLEQNMFFRRDVGLMETVAVQINKRFQVSDTQNASARQGR